jgi:hypothetical protein
LSLIIYFLFSATRWKEGVLYLSSLQKKSPLLLEAIYFVLVFPRCIWLQNTFFLNRILINLYLILCEVFCLENEAVVLLTVMSNTLYFCGIKVFPGIAVWLKLLITIYLVCCYLFILAVLGYKLRASSLLGRHSTMWATPPGLMIIFSLFLCVHIIWNVKFI